MATNILFSSFVVLLANHLIRSCSSLSIQITPSVYTEGSSGRVTVSCVMDTMDLGGKDVAYSLVILGKGAEPIVFVRGDGVSPSLDKTKYQADGLLTKNGDNSYLTLTIVKPNQKDDGTYTCKLWYSDETGLLKERKSSKELTIDKPDVSDVVEGLKVKLASMEKQLEVLTDKVSYRSAFSASMTGYPVLKKGNVVVFDDVIMREGPGYNETSGVFTAPRGGLYVFTLVMSNYNQGAGIVRLEANGKAIARMRTESSHEEVEEQSAATSVVNLSAGDQVRAVADSQMQYWGGLDLNCMLTGYMIKAD